MDKGGYSESDLFLTSEQSDEERDDIKHLILMMAEANDIICKANRDYKPHLIARYTLDLCQEINSFYQKYHILTAPSAELKQSRMAVLSRVQHVLKTTMEILGITPLTTM